MKHSPRVRTTGGPAVERGLAHRWARYATEAVLPFYAMHETVIVVIAFWLVRLRLDMVPK